LNFSAFVHECIDSWGLKTLSGRSDEHSVTATGPQRVYTTVRYLVVQSIAGQKPFMAEFNVPKAVCRPWTKRPFTVGTKIDRWSFVWSFDDFVNIGVIAGRWQESFFSEPEPTTPHSNQSKPANH
jgi:hypothetical protein